MYTAGELIKRPAAAIQEYIEGKRVRHFRPLAYVVILSALSSFTGYLVSMTFDGTGTTASEGLLLTTTAFFSKHPGVFYFLMIPLISLCTFGFFRHQYNYWENVVLNTYLTAQFNFLLILSHLLWW